MKDQLEFETIVELIFDTVIEVGLWKNVIKALCSATGCTHGIISLRETQRSDFIVPESVLESPLIYGFSPDMIDVYIKKYQSTDPWTPIEHINYPAKPIILSDFLPIDKLRDTLFWEWLISQNIEDTVTISLGKYATYWVGLNLYGSNDACKRAAELLTSLLPMLKQSWYLGEKLFEMKRQQILTAEGLADMPVPIFIFNEKGEITGISNALEALAAKSGRVLQRIVTKKHLLYILENRSSYPSVTAEVDDQNWRIFLINNIKFEDTVGRQVQRFLAMVSTDVAARTELIRVLFNTIHFSPRQTELIEHLKQGNSIASFAEATGISVDTAYHHWKEIKRITGVTSPKEIRLLSS